MEEAVKVSPSKTVKHRKPQSFDAREVKEMARGKWLDILPAISPALTDAVEKAGDHVPCPIHGGKDGFRLFADAAAKGGGICNTCGAFSDGFALLQKVNNWDFSHALREVAEHLGVEAKSGAAVPPLQGKQLSELPEDPDMNILAGLNSALERSKAGHPRLVAYLRSRGLTVDPPEVLTLSESEPYYHGGHQGDYPTMLAPVCTVDGKMVSLHRTYLDKDGEGKAPVDPAKKLATAIYKGATKGCSIQLNTPGKTLGVAEGIETALAVFEATGTPMWCTSSAGGMETVEIPVSVESVEIWADNDRNGVGQKAAKNLAKRLILSGIKVQILLPNDEGQDWLDVLNGQGKEAFAEAKKSSTIFDTKDPAMQNMWRENFEGKETNPDSRTSKTEEEVVEELNSKHFVVPAGGKVCIATEGVNPQTGRPTLVLGGPSDLRLMYANRRIKIGDDSVPIAELWIASKARRQYQGIIFAPGQEHPGYFNLFRGFALEPQAGDCSLFWDHVHMVICNGNDDHYQYLRKWMAHMIQKPAELPGVGIVVVGKQGTGKGVFVEELGALVGLHYMVLYRLDQVTGRFNSHLRDVLLLYANEAVTNGDKASEGVIKGLITDPTLPIEQKFVDVVQIKNCLRLIVTSNDERPVPIGMDDRRFLVLQATDAHKEDKIYFGNLLKQMENGGRAALMYDLLAEDLSEFDVRTAPRSRYSFDVKLRGAEPIDRWWFEKLVDGIGVGTSDHDRTTEWSQIVPRDVMHKDFIAFCSTHRLGTMEKAVFGKRLPNLMPGMLVGETRPTIRVRTEPGGSPVERRAWCYTLPTLEQCREAFQQYTKAGPEIWPAVTIE